MSSGITEKRIANIEKVLGKHLKDSAGELKKLSAQQTDMGKKVDGMVATVETSAEIIKNFRIGLHVGGKVVGFSGKTVMTLGAFFLALAAIVVGIKAFFVWLGLGWLVSWLP
jgi:hypothetical protein